MSRPSNLSSILICISLLMAFMMACGSKQEVTPRGFYVIETTIEDIHEAYRSGNLTCRELVEIYLERIDKYDKSTRLNAIVVVNQDALKTADELDKEFQKTGKLRPLHGIPVIVKDNYETYDMQTTGGSMALRGFVPPDDAYQVRKLREAGAIMLVKSNMAEWAFSPYQTLSSTAGVTCNPYDLNRVPAGSSGGTAAAVAANFGAVGLGTDTGNSIRGPSSHCALVGIRSTMGLTSRDGIIPLYLRNDIGGPMCRTVEDAVRILEVIAGYDPNDPITEKCKGKVPENYTQFLDKDGLKGAHIGVFRLYTDRPTADTEVLALFEQAIEDIKLAGAEIVDPFVIPDFGRLTKGIWCDMFRHDLNNYLAALGDNAPIQNLLEVYNKGLFATPNKMRIFRALEVPLQEEPACKDLYTEPKNVAFQEAVLKAMADQNVDFIIYPTWNNPPRKLNDFKSPAGDNSQLIPPHTGMPGFTVPMGFTYKNLPAGLQIVGRHFDEPDLIRVAYAYEQATQHRYPPKRFD
ncbi:MAG: amidase [Candidatus Aminicenantes bacterium]|nr:amidase [Candidatus Aminicenantes bacterium]